MSKRNKVILYITDAGGGHRSSANSLKAAIEQRGLTWDVTVVNIYRRVCPAIEPCERFFDLYGGDMYNWLLQHDLTLLCYAVRPMARRVTALNRKKGATILRAWLAQEKPDLCVSCMPFV